MATKAFTRFNLLRAEIQDLGVGISAATKQRVRQLRQGVELNKNEPFCTESGIYDVLQDGSVMHCYVHIPHKDLNSQSGEDPSCSSSWHKYHLLWCKACVSHPHKMKKFTRSDGTFFYSVSVDASPYEVELNDGGRELNLCRFCENDLVKIGLLEEGEAKDLVSFLNRDIKSLKLEWVHPPNEFDKIPNVYSNDWPAISRSLKVKREWKCERCRVDLSDQVHRRYLHAHHRDHLKQNNSIFNLEALCIRCHAKEHPNNTRLTTSGDLARFNTLFPDPDVKAQKPSEYLDLRGIHYVFHFTDTRNLDHIRKYGLLSHHLTKLNEIDTVTGGNQQSLDDDKRLGLDKYVHLCLIDSHPMEYRSKERGSIKQVKYLQIDTKALDKDGSMACKVVATSVNADPLPIMKGLPQLDLDILKSLNPDYKDPRYQNARKSELMVPDRIAPEFIINL